jgi:hypothetical protein
MNITCYLISKYGNNPNIPAMQKRTQSKPILSASGGFRWSLFFEKFLLVGGIFFHLGMAYAIFVVFEVEVFASGGCDFAATLCSAEKADLQKIRLNYVFECVPFFAKRRGEGVYASGAAVIGIGQRAEKCPIQFIKAERVDLLHLECAFNDSGGKGALAFYLRIIADAL